MPNDEEAVLDEVLENLREAIQRIRAVSNRLRATGITEGPDHRAGLALGEGLHRCAP